MTSSLLAILCVLAPAQESPRERIRDVRSWTYQLQRVDVQALARSPYDLVVVDHADDNLVPWDSAKVRQLRVGRERRIVLAYISLGEAESYRSYWRREWATDRPSWLGPLNPEWRDNFPVKYWDPDWRRIILGPGGYVDKILEQGFDGIYMDRLDVYTRWGPTGEGARHKEDSARAMVAFVRAVAHHIRVERGHPNFLMVAQNAPALAHVPGFLDLIDAFALEDIFFHGRGLRRSVDYVDHILNELLAPARARRLPIFAVDYLRRRSDRRVFRGQAARHGLVGFAAPRRELDRQP